MPEQREEESGLRDECGYRHVIFQQAKGVCVGEYPTVNETIVSGVIE